MRIRDIIKRASSLVMESVEKNRIFYKTDDLIDR